MAASSLRQDALPLPELAVGVAQLANKLGVLDFGPGLVGAKSLVNWTLEPRPISLCSAGADGARERGRQAYLRVTSG